MSLKLHSLAGAIRIEPGPLDRAYSECDDSTLELLLTSFAHRGCLANDQQADRESIHFVAARRLSWLAPANVDVALRANLARLLDDLQAELERLDRMQS